MNNDLKETYCIVEVGVTSIEYKLQNMNSSKNDIMAVSQRRRKTYKTR